MESIASVRLTLRIGGDDERTWPEGLLLERESGAADLAQTLDGEQVLCFYEQGWLEGNCIYNRELLLARVPLTELT